jgi:hypothetical protein
MVRRVGDVDHSIWSDDKIVRRVELRFVTDAVRGSLLSRTGKDGGLARRIELQNPMAAKLGQHELAVQEVHAERLVQSGGKWHKLFRRDSGNCGDEEECNDAHAILAEIETYWSVRSRVLYGVDVGCLPFVIFVSFVVDQSSAVNHKGHKDHKGKH